MCPNIRARFSQTSSGLGSYDGPENLAYLGAYMSAEAGQELDRGTTYGCGLCAAQMNP